MSNTIQSLFPNLPDTNQNQDDKNTVDYLFNNSKTEPQEDDVVNPIFPEKEPYVSAEEQMEALNLSQAQEQEPETISIKD